MSSVVLPSLRVQPELSNYDNDGGSLPLMLLLLQLILLRCQQLLLRLLLLLIASVTATGLRDFKELASSRFPPV